MFTGVLTVAWAVVLSAEMVCCDLLSATQVLAALGLGPGLRRDDDVLEYFLIYFRFVRLHFFYLYPRMRSKIFLKRKEKC